MYLPRRINSTLQETAWVHCVSMYHAGKQFSRCPELKEKIKINKINKTKSNIPPLSHTHTSFKSHWECQTMKFSKFQSQLTRVMRLQATGQKERLSSIFISLGTRLRNRGRLFPAFAWQSPCIWLTGRFWKFKLERWVIRFSDYYCFHKGLG